MVVELLASIQPLIFFQHEIGHVLSVQSVLRYYALPGSVIWQQIAVSTVRHGISHSLSLPACRILSNFRSRI